MNYDSSESSPSDNETECMVPTSLNTSILYIRNDSDGTGDGDIGDISDISDFHSSLNDSDIILSSSDEKCDLQTELKELFTQHQNIPFSFIKCLLLILKKYHPFLPKDPRTLLGTSLSNLQLRRVEPGYYHHFGIANGLLDILKTSYLIHSRVSLQINVDGLPPFKSNTNAFWPILCSVPEVPGSIFIAGIYYGSNKPLHSNDLLNDFVDELKTLLSSGIVFENGIVDVTVNGFCCDTPARAFVKCTKSHTGYFGCDRCDQKGQFLNNRMTFPEFNASRRTDTSFRNKEQSEHHHCTPLLQDIPIDMILMFPNDYMHSICKGVVITLLDFLRKGPLPYRCSNNILNQISADLLSVRHFIPSDFARRPRSLRHLSLWKATESRLFCLYLAPVILKKYVHSHYYEMFMTITLLMRILCHPVLVTSHIHYCKELAQTFLTQVTEMFGSDRITYNFHSILHLVEDCKERGIVDNFSCFQYEAFLGRLKKLIHSPYLPLQQIINRISGIGTSMGFKEGVDKVKYEQQIFPARQSRFTSDSTATFYRKLTVNDIVIKGSSPDGFVIGNNHLIHVKLIMKTDSAAFVIGNKYSFSEFTDFPLLSLSGVATISELIEKDTLISIHDLSCKTLCLSLRKKHVILPILHTYDIRDTFNKCCV